MRIFSDVGENYENLSSFVLGDVKSGGEGEKKDMKIAKKHEINQWSIKLVRGVFFDHKKYLGNLIICKRKFRF